MKLILFIFLITFSAISIAKDNHDHDHDNGHKHRKVDKHKHEKNHDHEEAHNHDSIESKTHSKKEDSHSHSHEGEGKAIGHGKAIESFDENKGFILSSDALKRLKVKTTEISSKVFWIKKISLVQSKKSYGVYILRKGYFKLIPLRILKVNSHSVEVEISDYQPHDKVIVSNVNLIRVTDIFTKDKSEYGHSH